MLTVVATNSARNAAHDACASRRCSGGALLQPYRRFVENDGRRKNRAGGCTGARWGSLAVGADPAKQPINGPISQFCLAPGKNSWSDASVLLLPAHARFSLLRSVYLSFGCACG